VYCQRVMASCGILILCSLLALGQPLAQNEKGAPQTEVIIISTVHNETAHFKVETLLQEQATKENFVLREYWNY
jgi:hypothetical protein